SNRNPQDTRNDRLFFRRCFSTAARGVKASYGAPGRVTRPQKSCDDEGMQTSGHGRTDQARRAWRQAPIGTSLSNSYPKTYIGAILRILLTIEGARYEAQAALPCCRQRNRGGMSDTPTRSADCQRKGSGSSL